MARSVLLKLTADPSDAKRGIDDVKDDIKGLGRLTEEARIDVKTEAAKAKLDKLHTQLRRLGSQESTPDVKIRTAKVVRDIEKIENDLDRAVGKRRRLHIVGGAVADSRAAGAAGLGGVAAGAKAGVAGAAAAGGVGLAFFSVKAANEAEVSLTKLKTQLKASGLSYDVYGKHIDNVIQKQSTLSGLDDEDLQDSFTAILRVTGNVSKSLRDNAIAADLARAKHIDVAKAGEIVAKVAGGNTGILKRYGIEVKKGATAEEGLAALRKKVAGQAEAYGKTTQGSLDRLSVAAENLGESIGSVLTPAVQWLADAIPKIGPAIRKAIQAIARFPGVGTMVRGVIRSLRGLVTFIKGVFHGDLRQAWSGIKGLFTGEFQVIRGLFRTQIELLGGIGKKIGGAIKSGIHQGMDGLVGLVRGVINKVIDAVNGVVGGVNKLDVLGVIPNIPKIGHVGADHTPKVSGTIETALPRKPRVKSRVASNVVVNVSTPGGGSPDPRVLAHQLGREIRRRGG